MCRKLWDTDNTESMWAACNVTVLTLEHNAGTVICNYEQCIICKKTSRIVHSIVCLLFHLLHQENPARTLKGEWECFLDVRRSEQRAYNCGQRMRFFSKWCAVRKYSSWCTQCVAEPKRSQSTRHIYSECFPSLAVRSVFGRRWHTLQQRPHRWK